MELILVVIGLVLIVFVLALLIWLINSSFSGRSQIAGQAAGLVLLQQQLEALKASQDGTRESLQKSLQGGQENLNLNLQTSQKVLGQLNTQIGELQGTNKQMLEVGTEVKRLHDILSSPKLRGQMGEWSLENLLSNILPAGSYKLQYSFKDGRIVDALIQLSGYSVPVDAKFPLSAFDTLLSAGDDQQRSKARKQFLKDVTLHIEKIASGYIKPAEGTVDFAIMYIPAENIYYEAVTRYPDDPKDITQVALDKKVILVSPNLFFAYLMTVVMGLHGLQIEKQAAEIRQNLRKLSLLLSDLVNNWEILGRHLRNATSQYEEGAQKLNRFVVQMDQVQSGSEDRPENS